MPVLRSREIPPPKNPKSSSSSKTLKNGFNELEPSTPSKTQEITPIPSPNSPELGLGLNNDDSTPVSGRTRRKSLRLTPKSNSAENGTNSGKNSEIGLSVVDDVKNLNDFDCLDARVSDFVNDNCSVVEINGDVRKEVEDGSNSSGRARRRSLRLNPNSNCIGNGGNGGKNSKIEIEEKKNLNDCDRLEDGDVRVSDSEDDSGSVVEITGEVRKEGGVNSFSGLNRRRSLRLVPNLSNSGGNVSSRTRKRSRDGSEVDGSERNGGETTQIELSVVEEVKNVNDFGSLRGSGSVGLLDGKVSDTKDWGSVVEIADEVTKDVVENSSESEEPEEKEYFKRGGRKKKWRRGEKESVYSGLTWGRRKRMVVESKVKGKSEVKEDKGKDKGKGILIEEVGEGDDSDDEGRVKEEVISLNMSRNRVAGTRRFTREEKGKGILISDDVNLTRDGSDVAQLEIGVDESIQGADEEESLAMPGVEMELQGEKPGTGLRLREIAESNQRMMDRFKDIARRNASRYAHYNAREGEENQVNVEEVEVPVEQPAEDVEDWPGPFATAMKIIRDREQNLNGEVRNSSCKNGGISLISWTPRKERGADRAKRAVPSLQDLCLTILTKNVDAIASLTFVPDVLRHKLSQMLCDSRRMNAHFLSLLLDGSPSEVRVADCSWLEEDKFEKLFEGCDTSNLTVLQLDLCGHCMSDSSLRKALLPKGLPALTTISFRGACRVSDVGLSALVSSASALRSMNLTQCSLLTDASIDSIANSLGSNLRELYLDDCESLDATRILPALKRLRCLEVLSLKGIGSVSDKFIKELVSSNGQNLKELVLANCGKLTDSSLKVIAETCSALCVLDLSHLSKLTDVGMAYLANSCRGIQDLKLCRSTFSDDAIAAFLETCGESLIELSLNNISKVGQNTAISLARRCKNLQSLDLSWCRSLTDEALGLIADSCSSLKLLKLFGCTQVTGTFLDGHSNQHLQIIGMKLTPILGHIKRPDFQQGPLHYSAVPSL